MKTVKAGNVVFGEGRVKICVPVTAADASELLEAVKRLSASEIDLIEFRADYYRDNCVNALRLRRAAAGGRPVLFTIRTKEEGGLADLTDEAYRRQILEAAPEADLVDVEYARFEKMEDGGVFLSRLKESGVKVIGSAHDFQTTPPAEEITAKLCAMQEAGFDISKIAVMPASGSDVLRLMKASLRMKDGLADRPYITMSMGKEGLISRCACSFTGSCLTFGTAGRSSAPGQIPASDLEKILDILHNHAEET
jgi:3-dehydroquinate dehydratase-1